MKKGSKVATGLNKIRADRKVGKSVGTLAMGISVDPGEEKQCVPGIPCAHPKGEGQSTRTLAGGEWKDSSTMGSLLTICSSGTHATLGEISEIAQRADNTRRLSELLNVDFGRQSKQLMQSKQGEQMGEMSGDPKGPAHKEDTSGKVPGLSVPAIESCDIIDPIKGTDVPVPASPLVANKPSSTNIIQVGCSPIRNASKRVLSTSTERNKSLLESRPVPCKGSPNGPSGARSLNESQRSEWMSCSDGSIFQTPGSEPEGGNVGGWVRSSGSPLAPVESNGAHESVDLASARLSSAAEKRRPGEMSSPRVGTSNSSRRTGLFLDFSWIEQMFARIGGARRAIGLSHAPGIRNGQTCSKF